MLDNKTILVTGASGILGQAACKIAGEHGAKTIEFDLAFTLTQDNRYEGDLTEKDSVQDLMRWDLQCMKPQRMSGTECIK